MISCNFAPNESWDDAWISFKLLFQPWRWLRGNELIKIKKFIFKKILISNNLQSPISFFLTGRSALYQLLKLLNLKEGDEILVQAFTCEAVVLPIIALNLKPVYIDIEKQSFSINPIDLEKKLTKKAKVLILQHTFGMTPKYRERIVTFVRQHNLVLIEDIAHGSNIKYQISKSKKHFLLLSFGRSKALSSVFGGAIIGNNKKVMKKLADLNLDQPAYSFIFKCLIYKPIIMLIKSTYNIFMGKLIHIIANKLGLIIPEITHLEKKGIYNLTLNKAYPNALAVLLLHQVEKFNQIKKNRTQICSFYNKKISNFQLLSSNFSLIRYPLLVDNRDFVMKKAAENNIFLGKWYDQPVAPKDVNLERAGYRKGSCPTAEKICQKIINLPTNINPAQVTKVIKILNDVIKT